MIETTDRFFQLWQAYCDKKSEVEDLKEQRDELLEALKAYHKAYDENPHLGPRGSQVDQAFVIARDIIAKAEAAE